MEEASWTLEARRWVVAKRYRYVYPFVFIHINKTGGSSIEEALRIPFEHKTAREKIAEIGRRTWERKTTFAVVRNPWDKVVSHFHYRVQTNQTGIADEGIGFADWVRAAYGDHDPRYYDTPIMFSPQRDWIVDEEGDVAVDRILRFESLEADFAALMSDIGRDVTLPHLKASKRRDFREYYDESAVEIVARVFAPDLELFGYDF